DENIFNVASQMIHKIEQRIAHTLPDDEVWFIYQYIISSGVAIDGQKDVSIISHMQASNEARLITWRLITVFSDIVDC
ncbi:PRD domain-containing protein, partial [Escherichia coli]